MEHTHVRIAVAGASTPGFEMVPAQCVGRNAWTLLRSPLYATGLAAGDVVYLPDPDSGQFEITRRGGNVCVHFYLPEAQIDDLEATNTLARELGVDLHAVGGRVDALTAGLICLTIPVEVGFGNIERVLAGAASRTPGAEWLYSNVYDAETGDPLGWWRDHSELGTP